MTTAEITTKVQRILAELLGFDPQQITPDMTWEDLNADSLDQAKIVMALEKEFDLGISDEDIDDKELFNKTIGECVAWLEAEGA